MTSASMSPTTTSAESDTTSTEQMTTTSQPSAATAEDLVVDTVATGLDTPWEMRFLPEGDLVVTERAGRILRVELPGGRVTELGSVPAAEEGEGGLMGLAVDPGFPEQPYFYVAYTYSGDDGLATRVSRLSFVEGGIAEETVLLDGIPAAGNHNGSRVAFGPDGALYVTTGDAGERSLAQDRGSLSGKVLRLTPEGKAAEDNPFPGSPVFTLGHRNPQGLAWHPGTQAPFVTEHGPDANDEVNALQPGGNYGWPEVGGQAGDPRFEDAVTSWTPTIAPAGAVFYDSDAIPGWRGSLLLVTLKDRDLRRLVPADDEFSGVAEEEILFDEEFGRLRAIAVAPDGSLYLATSNRDGRGSPGEGDDRILRVSFSG
jgi:glucose/arabinose dehydrogenase